MKADELAARFHAAQSFARDAGRLAVDLLGDRASLGIETKGLQDVVTAADRAVETFLRERMTGMFPADDFLGEEGGYGAAARRGAVTWVVDPIDGTVNFARGIPGWCVSIALVAGDRAEIGVIYDPVADELFAARRNGGASRNGVPIRASSRTALDESIMGLGFSYRRAPGHHLEHVRRLLEGNCEYRRLGSGALSLAYVADGRLDGYLEQHCNSWDVLAGVVLVREAGGRTNDFLANDGLRQGNLIFACAPGLEQPLLRVIGPDLGPVERGDTSGHPPASPNGRMEPRHGGEQDAGHQIS